MAKSILQSSNVATPAGIMSQGVAVPAGRMVFVSGQVARGVDGQLVGHGDISAQTRKVLENVRSVLAEAGATMDDVTKVTGVRHQPGGALLCDPRSTGRILFIGLSGQHAG